MNFMFSRYDIVLLTKILLLISGSGLLVGMGVKDYCFVLLNLSICVCALFDSISVFLTPSIST